MNTVLKASIPLFLILVSCLRAGEYSDIKVVDLHAILESSSDSVILLDVRTPGEHQKGVIPGAVLLNLYDDQFIEKASKLDTSKALYVYCARGGRSVTASKSLSKVGFKKVHNVLGGFSAWRKAAYGVSVPAP